MRFGAEIRPAFLLDDGIAMVRQATGTGVGEMVSDAGLTVDGG